jgi:hypothetical protein
LATAVDDANGLALRRLQIGGVVPLMHVEAWAEEERCIAIRAEEGFHYDERAKGILHVYVTGASSRAQSVLLN